MVVDVGALANWLRRGDTGRLALGLAGRAVDNFARHDEKLVVFGELGLLES